MDHKICSTISKLSKMIERHQIDLEQAKQVFKATDEKMNESSEDVN